MGWAYCGTDRAGREIGYAIVATCDKEGCEEEIDRGLANACGEMHGEDEHSCERYFCYAHLVYVIEDRGRMVSPQLCEGCAEWWEEE